MSHANNLTSHSLAYIHSTDTSTCISHTGMSVRIQHRQSDNEIPKQLFSGADENTFFFMSRSQIEIYVLYAMYLKVSHITFYCEPLCMCTSMEEWNVCTYLLFTFKHLFQFLTCMGFAVMGNSPPSYS